MVIAVVEFVRWHVVIALIHRTVSLHRLGVVGMGIRRLLMVLCHLVVAVHGLGIILWLRILRWVRLLGRRLAGERRTRKLRLLIV